MEEKKKTEKATFQAVQVPTQHTVAIQTPDEEVISIEQGIAQVLNDLAEIKKLVG